MQLRNTGCMDTFSFLAEMSRKIAHIYLMTLPRCAKIFSFSQVDFFVGVNLFLFRLHVHSLLIEREEPEKLISILNH